MAAPGTSISGHVQSAFAGDDGDFRYAAPEVGWPEDYGMDEVMITKESDVYGMAMVFYEARFHQLVLSDLKVKAHVNIPGLDGDQAVQRSEL